MKSSQFISVAMCTYNGNRFIEKQIKSILNQTHKVNEIIICDDQSTDDTVTLAEKLLEQSDIKYQININSKRLGITKNFEKCIGLCNGDIIFTCDQDDEWENDKIEAMIPYFHDPNVILVFSDATAVAPDGRIVYTSLLDHVHFSKEPSSLRDSLLRKQQSIYGCLMAFRKELYYLAVPFPETVFYHDGWLGINALLNGEIIYLDRLLIKYMISDNSITQSNKGQSLWRNEFDKGDSYDRWFTLNNFRKQRIELMKICLDKTESTRFNKIDKREMYRSVLMYDDLCAIKNKATFNKVLTFAISFVRGEYYYRNMNRVGDNSIITRIKMFVSDIVFLIRDK